LIAFSDLPGVELVPGQAIIELKYGGGLPLLFERLIAEFGLQPQPFSKYRSAAQLLGFTMNEVAAAVKSV
jgi:hypothetical protein